MTPPEAVPSRLRCAAPAATVRWLAHTRTNKHTRARARMHTHSCKHVHSSSGLLSMLPWLAGRASNRRPASCTHLQEELAASGALATLLQLMEPKEDPVLQVGRLVG